MGDWVLDVDLWGVNVKVDDVGDSVARDCVRDGKLLLLRILVAWMDGFDSGLDCVVNHGWWDINISWAGSWVDVCKVV